MTRIMMQKPVFSHMPKAHDHLRRQSTMNRHIPTNIIKNENGYEILLAVPGLEKKWIAMSVKENVLVIESNKDNKTQSSAYYLKQFDYSNFTKRFELSDQIDLEKISAAYNDGILRISLINKDQETANMVKKIEIK